MCALFPGLSSLSGFCFYKIFMPLFVISPMEDKSNHSYLKRYSIEVFGVVFLGSLWVKQSFISPHES